MGQKSVLFTLNKEKKSSEGLVTILLWFLPNQAPHQLKVDGVTIKCLQLESKKRLKALNSKLSLKLEVSTTLKSNLRSSFFKFLKSLDHK